MQKTALTLLSCLLGNESLAKKLIENGADVNYISQDGYSPLHYAAIRGELRNFIYFEIRNYCIIF